MGVYINPQGTSKEAWLLDHATDHSFYPVWDAVPEGYLPVCLVLNPGFTAAGVAYDKAEMEAFADPSDQRIRRWYMVRMTDLTDDVIGAANVNWLRDRGVLA
jgi:hypothetical protein